METTYDLATRADLFGQYQEILAQLILEPGHGLRGVRGIDVPVVRGHDDPQERPWWPGLYGTQVGECRSGRGGPTQLLIEAENTEDPEPIGPRRRALQEHCGAALGFRDRDFEQLCVEQQLINPIAGAVELLPSRDEHGAVAQDRAGL